MAKMSRKRRAAEPDPEPGAHQDDWTPPYGPRKGLPYPLLKLAPRGEVMSFRNGRFIPPLTAEEYSHAVCLREAAMHGEDFRSMLGSIQAAGFRIRPTISAASPDGSYKLIGLSFTRDGVTLPAAAARMRFSEEPDNPRAPCLERDTDLLLRLRAAYERDHAPQIEARKNLLADIRRIENSGVYYRQAAPMLLEAGITAARQVDQITVGLARSERQILSLQRDGAEVRIRWASCPTVWKATRHLVEEAAKEATRPAVSEQEGEPDTNAMEP